MVTFKQTITNLKADFARRILLEGNWTGILGVLAVLFKRGMVTVIVYRLSRYCIYNRLGIISRLLVIVDYLYTKNEISPIADLGPGLVLADSSGIGIGSVTIVGKNCTIFGCTTTTLGVMETYDVCKDRIVLGDHCVIGTRVRIMRPLLLANGTQILANSVVLLSVEKEGCTISGVPAKRRAIDSYEDIVTWNPLHGGFIERLAA